MVSLQQCLRSGLKLVEFRGLPRSKTAVPLHADPAKRFVTAGSTSPFQRFLGDEFSPLISLLGRPAVKLGGEPLFNYPAHGIDRANLQFEGILAGLV